MRKFPVLLLFSFSSLLLYAQGLDSTRNRYQAAARPGDTVTAPPVPATPASASLNVQEYMVLLSRDLRQAFTAPFHLKGGQWLAAGKFAAVAGALAVFDEPVQKSASRLLGHNRFKANISHQVTNFGAQYETYTLALLGGYAFLFKKEKLRTTVLLATQAYLTSAAAGKFLKFVTNRQRPVTTDSVHFEAEPVFHGPFYKDAFGGGKRTNSSFPSGHTAAAFAVATVFAQQYRDHPVIPIVAYSAATLVGLSRLTENKHWATDVLAGAALGYVCGQLVSRNFSLLVGGRTASQEPLKALKFRLGFERGRPALGLFYCFP